MTKEFIIYFFCGIILGSTIGGLLVTRDMVTKNLANSSEYKIKYI